MSFKVGDKVKFKEYTYEESRNMENYYGSSVYIKEDPYGSVHLDEIPDTIFIIVKKQGNDVKLESLCGQYMTNWVEESRLIPSLTVVYGGERDEL